MTREDIIDKALIILNGDKDKLDMWLASSLGDQTVNEFLDTPFGVTTINSLFKKTLGL